MTRKRYSGSWFSFLFWSLNSNLIVTERMHLLKCVFLQLHIQCQSGYMRYHSGHIRCHSGQLSVYVFRAVNLCQNLLAKDFINDYFELGILKSASFQKSSKVYLLCKGQLSFHSAKTTPIVILWQLLVLIPLRLHYHREKKV